MASSIASPTEGRHAFAALWPRVRRPLAVVVVCTVLAGTAISVTRTGLFRVRGIDVEGGGHLSRAEIVRLAGITKGDNAIWLDTASAEERLLRDPWIARADVHVDLPWNVTITVSERSAIATTVRGTDRELVAADGTILGSGHAEGLPAIAVPPSWIDAGGGDDLSEAARALAALDVTLRSRVRRAVIGGPAEGLELLLTDGLRVRFGAPVDFAVKTRVLGEVLAWIDQTGGRFRVIDVSAPSAPTVVPRA